MYNNFVECIYAYMYLFVVEHVYVYVFKYFFKSCLYKEVLGQKG